MQKLYFVVEKLTYFKVGQSKISSNRQSSVTECFKIMFFLSIFKYVFFSILKASFSEAKTANFNIKETSGLITTTTTSTLGPPTFNVGHNLDVPQSNPNLLSPDVLTGRRSSRRPSILPVPDMFISSSLSISGEDNEDCEENDDFGNFESEDELVI